MTGGNGGQYSNIFDLLLALKDNVFRNLHCADLMIVTSFLGSTYKCELLTDSSVIVECTTTKGATYQQGDVVLVLFTDSDFRTNLEKYKANLPISSYTTADSHSHSYGVIIDVIYRKETQE